MSTHRGNKKEPSEMVNNVQHKHPNGLALKCDNMMIEIVEKRLQTKNQMERNFLKDLQFVEINAD